MFRITARFAPLLSALLLLGCGSEDPLPEASSSPSIPPSVVAAGPPSAFPPISTHEAVFAAELARTYCDVAGRCCADAGLARNASCVEEVEAAVNERIGDLRGWGFTVFDPAGAATCLDMVRAFAVCRPALLKQRVLSSPVGEESCRFMRSEPRADLGGPCQRDHDCAPIETGKVHCDLDRDVCVEVWTVGKGEPCGPVEGSLEIRRCDLDTFCSDGVCLERAALGEPCTERLCAAGLSCSAAYEEHCQPLEGRPPMSQCEADSACWSGRCNDALGRCEASEGKAGDPCVSHWNCASGSCSEGGVCDPPTPAWMSEGPACSAPSP